MGAWETAVLQFVEKLSPEDKVYFTNSKPEDIINEIIQFEDSHRKSSKARRASERLRPLVGTISDYGRALDTLANCSSIIPPLWGSLRIVIIIAKRYDDYFCRIVEILEQIGDIVPRFSIYSRLFESHSPLQEALKAMYLQVLIFFGHVISTLKRSAGRIIAKAAWQPFDEAFQEPIQQLRRQREQVEEEVKLAATVEQIKERDKAEDERRMAAESRRKIEHLESIIIGQDRAAALCWLDGNICSGTKKFMYENRQQDSCQWILERKELHKWLEDDNAQIFWLHGTAGCGKSFIYSKIVDHLELQVPTMSFYFCGGDKQRCTYSALLRSWTLQLIEANPEAMQNLFLIRQRNGNAIASQEEVLELFLTILDRISTCYLAVDAFDECTDGEDFLKKLSIVPKKFKILATSRTPISSRKDVKATQSITHTFEIQPEMVQQDIDRFITASIQDLEIECSMKTKQQIQRQLSRHQGMFLWVKLMLDHINDQITEYDVLECLTELPDGLPAIYDSIMDRINRVKSRRLLALRLFFWILTVQRPVSVTELRTLLAVQPRLRAFDERRLLPNAETTIRIVCGGLINLRPPHQMASVVHYTVTQYLRSYLGQQHIHHEILSSYDMVNLRTNDALAAAVCLRFLSYEGLDAFKAPTNHTEAALLFKKPDVRLSLLSYAISNWFQHLALADASENDVWSLAMWFLTEDSSNRDFSWRLYWFASSCSLESVICPAQFSGLHIASYFGLSPLVELLIPVSSINLRASLDRTPLWWAVSRGHVEVSKRLIEAGSDPNMADDDLISPVHRAAALGNEEMLKVLLSKVQMEWNTAQDREGWTALHWAASRGHWGAIYVFRSKRYGKPSSRCAKGRTPLHLAALNGHPGCAKQLISWEEGLLNIQDNQGCTALHLAAVRGYAGMVRRLLDFGADPTVKDRTGKTAVEKARMMGNIEAVNQLLIPLRTVWEQSRLITPAVSQIRENLKQYEREQETIRSNPIDTQDASIFQTLIDGHQSLLMRFDRKRGWNFSPDDRARTALHLAAALGYEDAVKQVLRSAKQRSSEILKYQIRDPMFMDEASAISEPPSASQALERFVNWLDDRGWTALHYAAVGRFPEICQLLLQHGASTTVRNTQGLTAVDMAKSEKHRETLESIARYAPLTSDEICHDFGFTKLHIMARDGSLTEGDVETLSVAELCKVDSFGRTALYRATEMNNSAQACLITRVVEPGPEELMNLVFVAMADRNAARADSVMALVEFFLECLPSGIFSSNGYERTMARILMSRMITKDNAKAVRLLHQAGIDVNEVAATATNLRASLLYFAIQKRASNAAIYLIENGANGSTSLFILACRQGLVEVVECLLQHGADAGEATSFKETPLHAALDLYPTTKLSRVVHIVRTLLRNGASLYACDRDGQTAIWRAVHRWHHESFFGRAFHEPDEDACNDLRALLAENDVAFMMERAGEGPERGYVSIHRSAKENDLDQLNSILDEGVPPDWGTYCDSKKTPLQIAVQFGNYEAAKLLIDRGADIEIALLRWHWGEENRIRHGDSDLGDENDSRRRILSLLLDRRELDSKGGFPDWTSLPEKIS